MDRLWALKTDIDPLGSRRRLPPLTGIGILLTITRCTAYRCPYCRWPFKITWGPSTAFLGDGERACWHCKNVFWDGSNEWPEMSGEERERFILPISIVGYIGGLMWLGVLYASLVLREKMSLGYSDVFLWVAFVAPLGGWFIFRFVQVIRSIRRYNDRGQTISD